MTRSTLFSLLSLTLLACSPNGCRGSDTGTVDDDLVDADGDGFTSSVDCDDSDPAINQDADEICGDGIDNDCSGEADDSKAVDSAVFYSDGDGDGFGDENAPVAACEAPDGTVPDAGDCDDDDDAIHPDAEEVCDGVDNDCDGDVDGDAVDQLTWYVDDDGDGFGSDADNVEACELPWGYAENADDCDDSDADISPAAVEVCDDTDTDEDCDGLVDDADDSVSDQISWHPDGDGDGYGDAESEGVLSCDEVSGLVAGAGDCDDENVDINPGVAEICDDGLTDEDCDGLIDDDDESVAGLVVWYPDADEDGYGDGSATGRAWCTPPSGIVEDHSDCDDTDPAINPDADEVCDAANTDEDCDGLADDDDPSVSGQVTYFGDADGDGYGDDEDPGTTTCDEPSATSTVAGDCDDTDATTSPDEIEVCGDYVDNDCNGEPTECRLDGDYDPASDADLVIVSDIGWEWLGYSMGVGGDINGDGVDDLLVGAPLEWNLGSSYAGAVYYFAGPLASGEIGASTATGAIYGEAYKDYLADAPPVGVGDLDGSGYGAFVVGAAGNDAAASWAGAAYLVYGPLSGAIEAGSSDAQWYGESANDYAGGGGMAAADDYDGDGIGEIWVAAPYAETTHTNEGVIYLMAGDDLGTLSLSAASLQLFGEDAEDRLGTALDGGEDIDGDGVNDLLVAASFNGEGGESAGAAYVVYGPVTGSLTMSAADAKLIGSTAYDRAGSAVSIARDFDGDGTADIMVGAFKDNTGAGDSGSMYVLTHTPSGTSALDDSAALKVYGEAYEDYLGRWGKAGRGDVDGDGYGDFVVGAEANSTASTDGGAAYLVHGPATGTMIASDASARFYGTVAGDGLGTRAIVAGDLDGDGRDDVALGAPYNDGVATDDGAVYVYFGLGE